MTEPAELGTKQMYESAELGTKILIFLHFFFVYLKFERVNKFEAFRTKAGWMHLDKTNRMVYFLFRTEAVFVTKSSFF